jgi:hypothetical protein
LMRIVDESSLKQIEGIRAGTRFRAHFTHRPLGVMRQCVEKLSSTGLKG